MKRREFLGRIGKTGFVVASALGVANVAHADALDRFFSALRIDDADEVQDWLDRGFDPNSIDERFTPALIFAIREGAEKSAARLVQAKGLKLEMTNASGETALMLACIKGYLDLAYLLLGKGAKVERAGWSPLHYAAAGPNPKIVGLLLEVRANPNARSPNGTTPLMMAAQYGQHQSLAILLKRGADPKLKNDLGLDALAFAERGARPDALAILKRLQADEAAETD
jgi:ankyrin repeat protein